MVKEAREAASRSISTASVLPKNARAWASRVATSEFSRAFKPRIKSAKEIFVALATIEGAMADPDFNRRYVRKSMLIRRGSALKSRPKFKVAAARPNPRAPRETLKHSTVSAVAHHGCEGSALRAQSDETSALPAELVRRPEWVRIGSE
jgi:hypothetical protein